MSPLEDLNLTESTVTRLALIRFLYSQAVDQSRQPEPANSVAVLSFHDAIEWFVHLVASVTDSNIYKGKREPGLLDLLDRIGQGESAIALKREGAIRELNEARRSLKHYGVIPSSAAVAGFRESITVFFNENTTELFGLDFQELGFAELIQDARVKSEIDLLDQARKSGDGQSAANHAALAFYWIIEEFFGSLFSDAWARRRSPGLGNPYSRPARVPDEFRTRNRWMEDLVNQFDDLASLVTVIVIGVDVKEYIRFRDLTPTVVGAWSSEDPHLFISWREIVLDDAAISFCRDFTVRAALRKQLWHSNETR